ncbi:MAG: pseudouridine synthase [Phycisphaeraceae bacterium]|nr:pseudouridine synthase [Phycisphaeraceae bacterium]
MPRKGRTPSHSFADESRGPRLQRVMADAGVGSRRHCEALIEQGAVRVNGEVVEALPAWVDPARDRIEVEGRLLSRPERHVYVMLYKPKGIVSTNSDPEGRRRAIDLIDHPSKARLYPVGRLDIDSSGLLLLTNDGELANRLTHPRYEIHKIYEVTVGGAVGEADLAKLEAGIYLPARRGAPGSRTERSSLAIVKRDRDRTQLLMELGEGRNRQIRRMMLRLGHPVKKLRRVQMGPLRLRALAIGEWRDLTHSEVEALRAEAFMSPAERLERAQRREHRASKASHERGTPRQPKASHEPGAPRGPGRSHGPRASRATREPGASRAPHMPGDIGVPRQSRDFRGVGPRTKSAKGGPGSSRSAPAPRGPFGPRGPEYPRPSGFGRSDRSRAPASPKRRGSRGPR